MSDKQYWLQRWDDNNISFHRPDINVHLQRIFPDFDLPQEAKIFVPLCGKSHDMLWLVQQGYHVVGTELSALAVTALFEDNNLPYVVDEEGDIKVYRGDEMTIFQGDMFAIPDSLIMPCLLYTSDAADE